MSTNEPPARWPEGTAPGLRTAFLEGDIVEVKQGAIEHHFGSRLVRATGGATIDKLSVMLPGETSCRLVPLELCELVYRKPAGSP